MSHRLSVLVATPVHSKLPQPLTYRSERALSVGALVRVPLGEREVLGIVWADTELQGNGEVLPDVRPIASCLEGISPLSAYWMQLVTFSANYYQRSMGEVALAALPPQLRGLTAAQLGRRLGRRRNDENCAADPATSNATECIELTDEQAIALSALRTATAPCLLFGATGSGKTEVYLRAVQDMLAADPQAQALVMVPEINLTPQLEQRFVARFGAAHVTALHSGLTPPQRLRNWLLAHTGAARIVLGTRMAIFASMPGLRLIVVDEEHDPSYKQQEGARYSARDLAVYRGKLEGARVLLGSATPSLESWQACEKGRYQRLAMPSRVGHGALPRVRLVDMNLQPPRTVFSAGLIDAIVQRLARGEQSLIFLNRRGYAPVLACSACEWKSDCPHCSAYRVFHKIDRSLRCHHCGLTERVPRACPSCGNQDIAPIGRGTERLEEVLADVLATHRNAAGDPVRIARLDADSTRLKGTLETRLAQVHAGEVDVLVGTQMVTKGHDFRRITLVAALNPDTALFSADFRAPERLFSLLMQAAGRAGRDAQHAGHSEMWLQTSYATHPLFDALRRHDYPAFAAQQLQDREQAGMPPFGYQALVRAEARSQDIAQDFLNTASAAAADLPASEQVIRYPAVPMTIQRVANVERSQMLIESASRAALQHFLKHWQPVLQTSRPKGLIRWAVDVDPLAV